MYGAPARAHTMPIGPTVILLYCRYEMKVGLDMHSNYGIKLSGLRLCNYGRVNRRVVNLISHKDYCLHLPFPKYIDRGFRLPGTPNDPTIKAWRKIAAGRVSNITRKPALFSDPPTFGETKVSHTFTAENSHL